MAPYNRIYAPNQPFFTTIDLFCGAGGLSEGFRQAGFTVLAANDFDADAANTFKLNHPETAFLDGPIQNIEADDLLSAGGLQAGELDVLVGGPPCQAFSVYNHQRGMHDERSGLFREYLRIVAALMPRFVVMENVTGITSVGEGKAVNEIYRSLKTLGYYVESRILRSEDYGVPQERRRIFFIGSRDSEDIHWPEPTHAGADVLNIYGKRLKPYVTVRDAISDLPELKAGQGEEELDYIYPAQSAFQRLLRQGSKKVYNHVAPQLGEINLRRLKHIPQGGSWRDIPHDLLPAGMQRARRSDHTKRYGRLHPDRLCCTVLTKCDLHWGSYIHPSQERTLTVREAARFQSFPDKMRFTGSRVEQYRQVGNAVPPLLAYAVAVSVAKMLQNTGIKEGALSLAAT
jgi:DNA (cytosine-5)-methyltransferase 1